MCRPLWRLAFGLCCAVFAGLDCGASAADELAAQATAARQGQQVLILQNGQTLKGKISRSPTGYVVEHLTGRLVVPFEEVRVVGDDLLDAFHKLSESFVEPTAVTHFKLAQWAWSHHLPEEARGELVLALDRNPDYEEARELMARLDTQLKEARRAKAPAQKYVRMAYGRELPEATSLGGLSRETAVQFSTRIQPLLVNKCGNASCHGPKSEQQFQLQQFRSGGHPIHSERNLSAVLEYIDRDHPGKSPLLKIVREQHAGMNRPLFSGANGEQHLKLLTAWVQTAAAETAAESEAQQQRPTLAKSAEKVGPEPRGRGLAVSRKTASENDFGAGVDDPMASVSSEENALESAETDPFDPAEFNARHHGRNLNQPPRPVRKPPVKRNKRS